MWFRKYTQDKAKELGVVGWCRNTESGTVKGEAQGPEGAVELFKYVSASCMACITCVHGAAKYRVGGERVIDLTRTYSYFTSARPILCRYWVENEGSPHSRISNCIFRNERHLEAGPEFADFSVRR